MNRKKWKGLVAVEGIDGSGTTTLVKLLREQLKERNIEVSTGFEPTDGPIGALIREVLRGGISLNPESLALLYSADRREHLFGPQGVKEHLDHGRIYITDRYFFSSLAYQGLDCHWDWVDSINSAYPLPGHLIYISLPVDTAIQRLSKRRDRDIFETTAFQKRVACAYKKALALYSNSGMQILHLDSRSTPQQMCQEARSFLSSLLEGQQKAN